MKHEDAQVPPADAGRLETPVRPLRDWRVRRAKRKLAGLRAKLDATRQIWNACANEVPGALVMDMQELPRQIAEVEELLRQLAA